MEAMAAMGSSAHTTSPLKPTSYCRPPHFLLCHFCPRSSFSSSYRSFWASSRKALHRRGVCILQNAHGPFSHMTVSSSSFQRKQGSRYYTMPDIEKHKLNVAEYCELTLVAETGSPSTSSTWMRRYPTNRINSERKPLSGGFGNLRRLEEKKHVRKDLVRSTEKDWQDESLALHNLRKMRKAVGVTSIVSNAGCVNGKNDDMDFRTSGETTAKSAPKLRILQGSRDYENLPNSRSQQQTCYVENDGDTSLVSGSVNEKFASFVTPSAEVGLKGNDNDATNNMHNRVSYFSATEFPRNIVQSIDGNGALSSSIGQKQRATTEQDSERSNKAFVDNFNDKIYQLSRQKNLAAINLPLKDAQPNGSFFTSHPDGSYLTSHSEEGKETNPKVGDGGVNEPIERDTSDGKSPGADRVNETYVEQITAEAQHLDQLRLRQRLERIYDKVLVVDNISTAKKIVSVLTNQYRHLIHACDTEVAKIDVKQETPVDHGEVICFSICSGPEANFGNGKSCIWVDVLDGGGSSLLAEFAPFFEDPSIRKVWHNYSFDNHVIENYGLKVSGFLADTMHMARLWDSSRRTEGGYSLEALTGDPYVMSGAKSDEELIGKVSMKTIFGRKKLKKDGSEGKVSTIPPVEELQRVERKSWVCYSALDSISTLKLYQSLKKKLSDRQWKLDGREKGTMLDFYEKYWCPFGVLLVKIETEGMLVDRAYLAEIEKVAKVEQQVAADRFRKWASTYCPSAKYMNVGSDTQLRQLFFAGIVNRKDPNLSLPDTKDFKIPNTDKVIEEGKKTATKYRKITLHKLDADVNIQPEIYTAAGWPSVSGDVLKALAGKVSSEFDFTDEAQQLQSDDIVEDSREIMTGKVLEAKGGPSSNGLDTSAYGAAYAAFGQGQKGIEACHAIAALCEVCSIDSLISNFILPLQGSHVSGKNGRIHCSININTETGRLSARRPNLQNQPALEKDRYKIRQAFVAAPGKSLIVADYGQLELRILAHLANCKSMLDAFKAGGDFHSRTAMNMYQHIREAVEQKHVMLEWHPQPGEDKPPVPLLKDAFASERRKAKMLNFSIAYGKTTAGLARDWKVSVREAKETVDRWYSDRKEVLKWQKERKKQAQDHGCVYTLLGRARWFPSMDHATPSQKGHIERAAINTPVQGSAADVAMCAMLEIANNAHLKKLGWSLLLQVHDEVILEGPTESAEIAKAIVVDCMSKPFDGKNILQVDLSVDAKCAQNWYAAK